VTEGPVTEGPTNGGARVTTGTTAGAGAGARVTTGTTAGAGARVSSGTTAGAGPRVTNGGARVSTGTTTCSGVITCSDSVTTGAGAVDIVSSERPMKKYTAIRIKITTPTPINIGLFFDGTLVVALI